jgi:hypothetical protein
LSAAYNEWLLSLPPLGPAAILALASPETAAETVVAANAEVVTAVARVGGAATKAAAETTAEAENRCRHEYASDFVVPKKPGA